MTGKVTNSLPAGTLITGPDITQNELQLAVRNHSMPLEALRYEITPIGLHYLLIHFDIPAVDPDNYALTLGGRVRHPLRLNLEHLKARPSTTITVTLECAGNGRARLSPRPLSQPWLVEAVGTAEWTGTRLGPLLDEAGLLDQIGDVVFTGLDRGIQGDIEQQYERSLPLAECRRDEILLAYAINGQPLPPQHGFPLRLIVPGWYGMTHVKWLRGITVLGGSFGGFQQATAYHFRVDEDDAGVPVTKVDVSVDGGLTWAAANLGDPPSAYAWRPWSYVWDATKPGDYELCVRATDGAGNVQPIANNWNREGVQNNSVQRTTVVVTERCDQ